jgi:hypothetical protein
MALLADGLLYRFPFVLPRKHLKRLAFLAVAARFHSSHSGIRTHTPEFLRLVTPTSWSMWPYLLCPRSERGDSFQLVYITVAGI